METREKTILIFLLAAALLIKLAYLFMAMEQPSSVGFLSVDALYHYKWASSIASGHFLTNAPYFRAPLYPFILALLLKVSGGSLLFIRLFQLLAGCLTLYYAYRIAASSAGKTAGFLAVILMLFYPITTYFEGELLLDSMFTLFALMSLYFFVIEKDGHNRPLLAGLFFALAALTRPTIIIFLPFIVIYYLRGWRQPELRRSHLKTLLSFLIVIVVLVAPVTVINYLESDQLVLISYQGGINFYLGNNPKADGLSSTLPGVGKDWDLKDADYLAYKETGRNLKYGEQSYFWYGQGLNYIMNHPGAALKLFARKLYYIFSGHEVSNNRPLDEVVFSNSLLSYLPIQFSVLVALSILPLFLAIENRRFLYLLYGLIVIYGIAVAMFFVSSRFRLPMVPIMAITAGWGLVSLWDTIRHKEIGYRLFFAVACAAGLYILAASNIFPISLVDPQQSLFLRGNQSLRQGNYNEAIARFDSLVQVNPTYENGYLNLGIAYLKMGDVDRAADEFRSEMQSNPNSAEAANNLGVIYLLRHENDSARTYFRKAISLKPYYTEAAINLLRSAKGESRTGVLDSIEAIRQEIRSANQNQPSYIFEEALYFTERGRYSEAIDNHLRILDLLSNRPPSVSFDFRYTENTADDEKYRKLVCYQLGYLYGLSGEFESSVRFSKKAIDLDPNLKEAYINLISAYRSLGNVRLADSVATVYLSHWPEP